MDSTFDANRPWNKNGEALVQEELGEPTGQTTKGYNYWGKNPEVKKEAPRPRKTLDDIIADAQKQAKKKDKNNPFKCK
jgi:hypothetical protein